jgi:hypothetical protein
MPGHTASKRPTDFFACIFGKTKSNFAVSRSTKSGLTLDGNYTGRYDELMTSHQNTNYTGRYDELMTSHQNTNYTGRYDELMTSHQNTNTERNPIFRT